MEEGEKQERGRGRRETMKLKKNRIKEEGECMRRRKRRKKKEEEEVKEEKQ